jgi:hypothetical protein
MTNSNPLAKHFRQPAIYLRLPSQGQYWPENAITLPVTGELPVYPMTTKDEITLRTPDALINGSGVVSVIESCIPSIVDPWAMPSIDVDACLIAIRIASYGNDMKVSVTCPECKSISDHEIDLANALDQISVPNFNIPVEEKDLTIKLKPQNYFSVNRTNTVAYEEQRILAVLNNTDMPIEEKELNIKEITNKLVDLNTENLASSTEYILMSDGTRVADHEFIKEFYANTSSQLIRNVQDRLVAAAKESGLKPYQNVCSECSHEFTSEVTFDYANFFGLGS